VEESKGDKKGYDQLIIDANRNGDLTDDAVWKPVDKEMPASDNQTVFGPIALEVKSLPSKWKPVYYASLSVYNREMEGWGKDQNLYLGRLRLIPAWHLEATVEVNGVKQKVALVDGNADGQLGDCPKPQTYKRSNEENWYFLGGDTIGCDVDKSGEFGDSVFSDEVQAYTSILYFGAEPCKASLSADCKSLSVEPLQTGWGQLKLKPQGAQVARVTLAWESEPGQWQLLNAVAAKGLIKVPAGNHRLYACRLSGAASDGETIQAMAFKRTVKDTLKVEAGQTTDLVCGAPLKVKVTAEKGRGQVQVGNPSDSSKPVVVDINAEVSGAGGEAYSGYAKGKEGRGDIANPTYSVLDEKGKKVASGNLEFG
jgi:hypothetical protein